MNFCQASLGTTISVLNQVESEGYEAKTLLEGHGPGSSGLLNKSGFLSESFCRPPVTLRLEFSLPIEISHIVIGPKVGQQISNAFVLRSETTVRSLQRSRYGSAPQQVSDSRPIHEIAKEYINDSPVPNLLVFRNPRFLLRAQYCNLRLGQFECHRNYPGSFQLRHSSYDSCEKVVALEVTIQRVVGFCVPAIGYLAVWGQPAVNASHEQIQNVLRSGSNQHQRNGDSEDTQVPPKQETLENTEEPATKKSRIQPKPQTETSVMIPEEFLDPISFEIMLKPVRLPCGIAIDFSTLERYNKEEAIWGRVENDPYTGVCFTETLRPLPDAALKSRIDAFLTKNANDPGFKTLPRVLGSGTESNIGYGSSRISHLRTLFKNTSNCNVTSSGSTSSSTVSGHSVGTSSSASDGEGSSSGQPFRISAKDFMDQEMARILGASTYKSNNNKTNEITGTSKCLFCEKAINSKDPGSGNTFYSSACKHVLVCRPCLLKRDKNAKHPCKQCGKLWLVSELTRIFT